MEHVIDLENEVIVLSLETVNRLFAMEGGADAVALYLFYHKQSKLQRTNQSWSTGVFCQKGLGWGEDRFRKSKRILRELGLIEDVRHLGDDGKIVGWYVKLKYIKSSIPSPPETTLVEGTPDGGQRINAGSSSNSKPGSSIKEKENTKREFQSFWTLYPRKVGKGTAEKAFEKLKPDTIPEVMEGLEKYCQKWNEEGTQEQYIPHPATWLNGKRWQDEVTIVPFIINHTSNHV